MNLSFCLACFEKQRTIDRLEEENRELRHRLGTERTVRDFAQRNAESFRDALQECAVARGALRVQPEIADRAVLQNHDLDVHAADVADAIRIRKIMQSGGRMGNGLDHAAIRAQYTLQ